MTKLEIHVREPSGEHRFSFIFLHGYDCDARRDLHFGSWCYNNVCEYKNLRVICPSAMLLKTSAPGYPTERVRSWYDFENGNCEGPDDKPVLSTLEASCFEIHKIINEEMQKIGIHNVFLGGTSQGGCTAVHCCSTLPHHLTGLGGLYVSIAHVLPVTDVTRLKMVNGPVVFCNGSSDPVYDWEWVKITISRLRDMPNVEIWREEVGHIDDGNWISSFLSRILPVPSLQEQIDAYDAYDTNSAQLE